jgi:DNA polymerase III alpha subunit
VCEYIKDNEARGTTILSMKIKKIMQNFSCKYQKEKIPLGMVTNSYKATIKMIFETKHANVWTKLKWLRNGSNGTMS